MTFINERHNPLFGGRSPAPDLGALRLLILGKDGIFAAALIIEMLARTGKKISELRPEVHGIAGRLYAVEVNVPATPEMGVVIPKRLEALAQQHAQVPVSLGGAAVVRTSKTDGTKFYLENDTWALMRFSGTEPILRMFAEADSPEQAQSLVASLKDLLMMAP